MRLSNTTVKLAVTALFAGGVGAAAVNLARAASPQAPTHLAETSENDKDYIQHLRGVRRALNENKTTLNNESMSDRAGHRHAAVEALDKAVNELNTEIETYDKDVKTGK